MDIASTDANAIIKPERGTRWRFLSTSKRCSAIATQLNELPPEQLFAYNMARTKNTFGLDFSICDSVGCCGAVVALAHPDMVPRWVWWRVTYFFDRDGKEANVFVWSDPERTFFRRSAEWFNCRVWPK